MPPHDLAAAPPAPGTPLIELAGVEKTYLQAGDRKSVV